MIAIIHHLIILFASDITFPVKRFGHALPGPESLIFNTFRIPAGAAMHGKHVKCLSSCRTLHKMEEPADEIPLKEKESSRERRIPASG
jgi:hypothetical protein